MCEWVKVSGEWFELLEVDQHSVTIIIGSQRSFIVHKSMVDGYRLA